MKINACSEQIQLDNLEMVIGKITKPVILEIWNGRQKDSVIRREYPYTKVTQTDDGLKAYASQSLIDLVSIPFLILHIVYAAVNVFYICLLFHRSSSPFCASFSYSS